MKITALSVLFLFAGAGAAHADCFNFSGTWKGTCRATGQAQAVAEELVLVQNGCSAISFAGKQYTFGRESRAVTVNGGLTQTTTTVVNWDTQPAKLVFTYNREDRSSYSGSKVYTDFGVGYYQFSNGKLTSQVMAERRTYQQGGSSQLTGYQRDCVFTR